jgi:hypothetical protein
MKILVHEYCADSMKPITIIKESVMPMFDSRGRWGTIEGGK